MGNQSRTIDHIIEQNKAQLGDQYNTCKNHVYRVFMLCLKTDNSHENIEKYAIAAAFHALGIWTASTFDYLEPSISLAKK